MIIYTPVPLEEVLQGSSELAHAEYIQYEGKMISVMKTSDGKLQISQLISTEPNDYMNPQYVPGTFLS